MFNLNIPAASLLNVDNGGGICTTPKTPEIVNTLIAMTTNPLDNYSFMTTSATTASDQSTNTSISPSSSSTSTTNTNTTLGTTTGINNNINNSNNQQLISQDSSHSSCSGSSFDSPTGTNSTPSVQQTCSQFIKAGLKITIQNKRKMSSCDSSSGTEQGTNTKSKYARKSINGDTSEEDVTDNRKSSRTGLTPEDEDRRRRRRERNKIAATKCRMKKRERTQNLINESEQLETQNVDMKTQIRNLEMERRQLSDMLESHASSCIRPGGYQPSPNLCQSPAYKYLQELGFCDSPQQQLQQQQSQQHDMQQQQMQQKDQPQLSPSQRQPIPSVNTIKFPRNNGLIQQQPSINTNVDLLPNGYCKASPTTHELGYLNSPSNQDLTVCMTNASPTHHHHHHHHHHQHHHNLHQNGNCASPHTAALLKSDYIPNCENTDGSTNCGALSVVDTCNTTADFVLKNELVDTQSPYTTAQSAERFLFETNCENFDIKHITNNLNNNNTNNNNNNNNNNINSHNNINTIVDFHTQLIATPVSCQPSSYDSLLIKNDFLTTTDTDLLAQLTDTADAEFTDLDSGVTAYSHMTNGGCLA